MNLDDQERIKALDHSDMIGQIRGLPDQLQQAWQLGMELPLQHFEGLRQVIVAGMGGSAIGADLVAGFAACTSHVPVLVHRDYELPSWARGPETLVIASSHSGNTEETISAYKAACDRGCRVLCISTDGRLGGLAEANGTPVWRYVHQGQPRAAVGYSFGLLLAALVRQGLLPDPQSDLLEAVAVMKAQQQTLGPEVGVARNPAKRLAGQLFGRWVSVLASGILAPVARRWKGQISELAKAWAQFEFLPEADHNTLAGVVNPVDVITRTMTIFLRAPSDHPRNSLRATLTQEGFMIAGLNTDSVEARGKTPLAHIWSCLHFGDYVAYYLAIAYGIDPTPVDALEALKQALAA
jgi:glucose/mannose-6-phosphate isomerase